MAPLLPLAPVPLRSLALALVRLQQLLARVRLRVQLRLQAPTLQRFWAATAVLGREAPSLVRV